MSFLYISTRKVAFMAMLLMGFLSLASCQILSSSFSNTTDQIDPDILFPRSFGIAVNQVGYMQGGSLDATDGPWRAGIRRYMDVRDYQPIAEVGEAVGVRFMSLFALAEMDRLNIVATLPYATQAGHNFDNTANISNKQLEIMDFVKANAASIELGVTGVGHEWWEDGVKTRSEWYSLDKKEPRPEELMRKHMDVIKNILWQYGISEEQGHSFPESFSALGFHFNPAGPFSTGKLFSDYGVKYVNTKFYIIPELNPPPQYSGGFDHGVLILDREGYGNVWHGYGALPEEGPEAYETDIIESHWANWLATDDAFQSDVNEAWIQFFQEIQAYPYRYLAKNSEQLYSQWLYKEFAEVRQNGPGSAIISNHNMPDRVYQYDKLGNMVLSIPLAEGEHLSHASLNGVQVPSILEEAGYAFIYLPRLSQSEYIVNWDVGQKPMQGIINNTGTYVVNSASESAGAITFNIKMYGTQNVRFRVEEGYSARTTSEGLTIHSQHFDTTSSELVVQVSGRNIQGEVGEITIFK
ncbi:MAG: hypothetical protein LAT57_04125 [Balneolales bacterium]|nr:hypothetical protein [Balneolales bacterium]